MYLFCLHFLGSALICTIIQKPRVYVYIWRDEKIMNFALLQYVFQYMCLCIDHLYCFSDQEHSTNGGYEEVDGTCLINNNHHAY